MTTRHLLVVGCSLATVLLTAGCEVRGNSPKSTSTPDDVFLIVTATPGTPNVPTRTPQITTEYVVQPGDSLLQIAVKFGVTLAALQEANDIKNPDSIYVGQRLEIPAPDD